MTRQMQKGFTLIELMIVVAIIGILAAVGIPQYNDYITKAKASKIATSVDALKQAVAQQYQEGVFPQTSWTVIHSSANNPSDWSSWLGLSTPPQATADVSDFAITDQSGAITVTLTSSIKAALNGKYVTWLPVSGGSEVDWLACTDALSSSNDGASPILVQQVGKWSNAAGAPGAAYTGGALTVAVPNVGSFTCTPNG